MAEVKWIKLSIDMFDNKKIKYIRHLPEGETIVLIWVMLLTMAGRCNAGGMIFLTENVPYTPKTLADELGFDESIITLALGVLSKLGMLSVYENKLFIDGWEEHQNVEGMELIKEQNRERQRRFKDRKRQLTAGNVTSNVSGNVTVTQGNATDIDIDIDIDKDISILSGEPDIPYKEIVEYLNEKLGTNYKPSSKKTRTLIHARFAEGFTKDDFFTVIDKKVKSWKEDKVYCKYLRPETLFGTKFESYLNEQAIINESHERFLDELKQWEEENVEVWNG